MVIVGRLLISLISLIVLMEKVVVVVKTVVKGLLLAVLPLLKDDLLVALLPCSVKSKVLCSKAARHERWPRERQTENECRDKRVYTIRTLENKFAHYIPGTHRLPISSGVQ